MKHCSLIFFNLFVIISALTSCNNSNVQPGEENPQSTKAKDSTLMYADDPIDDSLLNFLDALPTDNNLSSLKIQLNDNLSLGEYKEFLSLSAIAPEFFKNESDIINLVDSLNHRKGIIAFKKINLLSMKKSFRYFSTLDSSEKKWINLLTKLTETAIFLTTKSNFQTIQNGNTMPAQTGLAYSWGIKDYKARYVPTKDDSVNTSTGKRVKDTCNYKIFGLDCSGFISTLFVANGINMIPGRAEEQRQTKYLKSLLLSYFKNDDFDVIDMGHITNSDFKTGDIVYRYSPSQKKAVHIGIILRGLDNTTHFCESHGQPADCQRNLERGPTMSTLRVLLDSNFRAIRVIPK